MQTPNLLSLATALALHTTGAAAVIVQDVVDDVSYDSYRAYLGYPGDGGNPLFTHARDLDRRWSANHDLARTNIFNHFSGLGLATTLPPFSYSGTICNNVVAVLPGRTRPNDIFIIGAHFDSVACPGADDNASGMVSLDMIAYKTGGNNTVDIYGRISSDPVKLALADAVRTYGGLTTQVNVQYDASNHASFEMNGFQAALLIEDWGNPYYHTTNDNVDTPSCLD